VNSRKTIFPTAALNAGQAKPLKSTKTNTTNPNKMKKTILLIGLTMTPMAPMFGQGFMNFSWFGTGTQGIQRSAQVGNPSYQLSGWYVSGDYSVQAYMAAGAGQAEGSLVPIAAAKTVFIGGAITTAAGSPTSDGSGLWQGPIVDTGLPIGVATIEVKAWYDPNHNTTWEQAAQLGLNRGESTLLNITLVGNTDPTINSLDTVGMAPFTVQAAPEPSTIALAGLGAAALLFFRRRKCATSY